VEANARLPKDRWTGGVQLHPYGDDGEKGGKNKKASGGHHLVDGVLDWQIAQGWGSERRREGTSAYTRRLSKAILHGRFLSWRSTAG
jgi:hypothetical protein